MLLTTTRGSGFSRVARGALGLSMLARGATGYCHVKAALTNRAGDAIADLTGGGDVSTASRRCTRRSCRSCTAPKRSWRSSRTTWRGP